MEALRCMNNVVLIRASGPDTRDRRTFHRPFFFHNKGIASFTSSGILFDEKTGIIVTSAALVLPFRSESASSLAGGRIKADVVSGTQFHVLFDQNIKNKSPSRSSSSKLDPSDSQFFSSQNNWEKIEFVGFAEVPNVADGISKIVQKTGLSSWEVGWTSKQLLTPINEPINEIPFTSSPKPLSPAAIIFIAIFKLPLKTRRNYIDPFKLTLISQENTNLKRGETLWIVSSPFGLLSPELLFNSVSSGVISNVITTSPKENVSQTNVSLLLTDCRCHPGSEGGAAFNAVGSLVGVTLEYKDANKHFKIMEYT